MKGDIILVSKLHYGTRIVKILKLFKDHEVDFFRLPALYNIKSGDILLFNSHKINYFNVAIYDDKYAIKRCYTTSGHYVIIKRDTLNCRVKVAQSYSNNLFPICYSTYWSLDNYGPLYVPAQNDVISLDNSNLLIYKHIILNEDPKIQIESDSAYRFGVKLNEYRVRHDYFFVIGDNFYNSIDSRHWGFVSKKDIVGKAVMILFSIDNTKKGLTKIRLKRIFKRCL